MVKDKQPAEKQPIAKEKQKKTLHIRAFARKHIATPAQKKDKQTTKDKQKVVDMEAEEGQGTKDIDDEGA